MNRVKELLLRAFKRPQPTPQAPPASIEQLNRQRDALAAYKNNR